MSSGAQRSIRILQQQGGQVFLTGTDPLLFETMGEGSRLLRVDGGQVHDE